VKRLEETRHIGKRFLDETDSTYGASGNAAVIILSGNRSNLGTIINSNHELGQILGYKKNELLDENINIIMPEIIGKYHNTLMQHYFEKQNQTNANDIEDKLVFAQHCKGYIVPCFLLVRLIHNLERGVQFLGFVAQAKHLDEIKIGDNSLTNEDVLLLLLDESYKIQGFNFNVGKLCCEDTDIINYRRYLQSDQKVDFGKMYQEIFVLENEQELYSPIGVNIQLDFSLLKNAIGAEITDYYIEEREEGKGSLNIKSNENASNNEALKIYNTALSISMKKYAHCKGKYRYIICTMLLNDQGGKKLNEISKENQDENQEAKQNLKDLNSIYNLITI